MSNIIETAVKVLEPEAVGIAAERGLEDAAVVSLAISFKRVADALERLAGEGHKGWRLADIAGVLVDRDLR